MQTVDQPIASKTGLAPRPSHLTDRTTSTARGTSISTDDISSISISTDDDHDDVELSTDSSLLPDGWVVQSVCPLTGKPSYKHIATGAVQWEKPTPPPAGWTMPEGWSYSKCGKTQKLCYEHISTGAMQWERPLGLSEPSPWTAQLGSQPVRPTPWPPALVAIGAQQVDAEPILAGSGFIVHLDGKRCIICTCAHVVLTVRNTAERSGGSVLDPIHYGVAVGIGDPVVWREGCTAFIEHISPPHRSCHPLAPVVPSVVHAQPTGAYQLDLAILVIESDDGSPGEQLAALPLGDSQDVHAGDELVLLGYGQPGMQSSLVGTASASQQVSATVTRGVCAGIIEDEESGAWIKTDALMLAGHSGGPVIAASGRVVGWSVSSARDKVADGGGSYACGLSVVRPINMLLPALGGVLATHGLLKRDVLLASPAAREAAVRRAVAGARPSEREVQTLRMAREVQMLQMTARVEQRTPEQWLRREMRMLNARACVCMSLCCLSGLIVILYFLFGS